MFDRILAHHGPEAKDTRDALRRIIANTVALLWPEENTAGTGLKAVEGSTGPGADGREGPAIVAPDRISTLDSIAGPLQMSGDLQQFRWLLIEQEHNGEQSSRGKRPCALERVSRLDAFSSNLVRRIPISFIWSACAQVSTSKDSERSK